MERRNKELRIDRIKFCTELARKDITLTALSELTGISRQTLSAVKQGKSCKSEIGSKIAKALEVNITEIIED